MLKLEFGPGWYRGYPSSQGADDLGHAAARRVQHALGAGLEQQHAGQVEDQGRLLRLLQLLDESLTVQEQRLPAAMREKKSFKLLKVLFATVGKIKHSAKVLNSDLVWPRLFRTSC